jgi:hypothetical protein
MCEERRQRLHEAAVAKERAASPYAGLPLLEGLTQQPFAFVALPPGEATVRLARAQGEAGFPDLWARLHGAHEAEKAALAEARREALRCGFAFSAKLPKRSARRVLLAVVRCPYVRSALGEQAITDDAPRGLVLKMQAALHHALQVERRQTEAVGRECGFLLTEAKAVRGVAGSWTALSIEGSVPLHAETPEELRYLMREAANAPQAPQVEASMREEETAPADEAEGAGAADVVDVAEPPTAPVQQLDAGEEEPPEADPADVLETCSRCLEERADVETRPCCCLPICQQCHERSTPQGFACVVVELHGVAA